MFGTNPRYKKNFVEAPAMVINSVFMTIQGEGPYAGTPAVFVRTSHCNLACTFCDTEFEKGGKLSPQELMHKVMVEAAEQTHRILVVTGGEPLLQDMSEFFEIYLKHFPHNIIQIETAGTVWQDSYERFIKKKQLDIVVSPKTPTVHKKISEHASAWKYIISATDKHDVNGIPVCTTQPGQTKPQPLAKAPSSRPIYLQPMDEQHPVKNIKNADLTAKLCMKHGYKISLQTHKILSLP